MARLLMYGICCLLLLSSKCQSNQNSDQSVLRTGTIETSGPNEISTIYFLLTDRFYNGDKGNDFVHPVAPAAYRGYMGGDIKGITQKLREGYFDSLGVDAIWMTPLFENIAEGVDEGSGFSYGFHGYWVRDWTAFDRRVGTKEDFRMLVEEAHKRGIKILFDVIVNHTGPVTPTDTQWPDDWVRTGPQCTYKDYKTTIECTLVKNLPDIRTESTREVELPLFLTEKWKKEGRYDREISSLDGFFKETGYPRRPFYYIIKWLTDLIREFGIDGYRVDTVKHTEEEVWAILRKEADRAHNEWKQKNPGMKPEEQAFYMLGEVYNYNANAGRIFDFGDRKVDYFSHGFDALINFGFKYDAAGDYETLFSRYDAILQNGLQGLGTVHYISSHDDGDPFDRERKKPYVSANKLLLSPGTAQIYYGDESARSLTVQANGDARLRSFMNWEQFRHQDTAAILQHWKKLGKFRKNHPSVAFGAHQKIQDAPYVFSRVKADDRVVIGLDLPKGEKSVIVSDVFKSGEMLRDAYTGTIAKVEQGKVRINSPYDIVLLEAVK